MERERLEPQDGRPGSSKSRIGPPRSAAGLILDFLDHLGRRRLPGASARGRAQGVGHYLPSPRPHDRSSTSCRASAPTPLIAPLAFSGIEEAYERLPGLPEPQGRGGARHAASSPRCSPTPPSPKTTGCAARSSAFDEPQLRRCARHTDNRVLVIGTTNVDLGLPRDVGRGPHRAADRGRGPAAGPLR